MNLNRNQSYIEMLAVFAFAATIWLFSLAAHAAGPAGSKARGEAEPPEHSYEIKPGDSLSEIAEAHGLDLESLMEANDIENPDRILAGTRLVLPLDNEHGEITRRGVLLTVPRGITLSRIAELYDIPVRTIARANKMRDPNQLRAGQKLLVPGARRPIELIPPPPCYKDPVTLYRVRTDESRSVSLCFCDGKPNPAAVQAISELSAPVGDNDSPPLDSRLVQLLQRVSDRFPGRRIELISGYRPGRQASGETHHSRGQAIDFRVEGVSNRTLAFFVRAFDKVGVGFYPNSVFIHMDVRDRNAWWIDYSRPGERAIYGRADMTDEEVEAVRARRAAAASEEPAPSEPVADSQQPKSQPTA